MDEGVRRIADTRLIDHDGVVQRGDFLLHPNGSYSKSKGDEDVIETIDGSGRLVTRSLQNWHTHLAMILNRGMGEALPLMEWLETAIFPVEKNLTAELVEIGTRAAAAEMIATGTTFACDMYFYTETIGETLAETGVRAALCGPITDGVSYNVDKSGGVKTTLFGGEGLVLKLSGSGKCWIQTRNLESLASKLIPFMPRPSN